jgi:replicative DNA helicase
MAVVAVTQGNRSSDNARTVTAGMVAEDWSKIGTADTVLTYSQTSEEKEIGLARVLVAAARDARDKYVVMISQSYATCQFCIDSVYMSKFVESEVDRMTGNGKNEE